MFNLNDPLLQAIMASLVQQQQSQQAGITPAFAQGAQPVSSGSMTSIGLNQPLNVSPQRAATLSPLEQQLSQAANMRAAAQPDADRLAFEQDTLGFLDTINQQNTGVYDRRMAAQAQVQAKQAEQSFELKKLEFEKNLDAAAQSSQNEAERLKALDTEYLKQSGEINKLEMAAPEEKQMLLKDLTARYRILRESTQKQAQSIMPGGNESKARQVLEVYRSKYTDDEIRSMLADELKSNPSTVRAQMANMAMQLLGGQKQEPSKIVGGLSGGGRTAAMGAGGKSAASPSLSGGGAPLASLDENERKAALDLHQKLKSVVPAAKEKGQVALEGMKQGLMRDLQGLGWGLEKANEFVSLILFGKS